MMKYRIEHVNLSAYHVDEQAVAKIPKQIAQKYSVIAIASDGNLLTVAVHDPMNLYAIEDIRLVTNMELRLVQADKEEIDHAIELYYSEIDLKLAVDHAVWNAAPPENVFLQPDMGSMEEQAPIVRLLNNLLIRAYNTNVSDIHLEPFETGTVVRMRRDGMLLPYMTLSPVIHQGLVARTKILSQMDIAEKRRPQDGHFKITLNNYDVNVRVSFIPTVYGEKGVLCFLSTNAVIDHNDTFGMDEKNYRKMLKLLKYPNGIIYVTGPTGSGKTTTLYSILQYLAARPVNISTIEDPIEKNIAKINQMQINEKAGITFSSSLRALLRQDPDIIMVGETRDRETAEVSARAALTGHLVFSTLHTNNAVASVIRLQDLGLPPYMLSAALSGVVAQRLVRKICPYCKETYKDPDSGKVSFRGKGCRFCDNTGYKGRTAIFEILEIDEGFRSLITNRKSLGELKSYARNVLHMETLEDEARKLLDAGIISTEELERVNYSMQGGV